MVGDAGNDSCWDGGCVRCGNDSGSDCSDGVGVVIVVVVMVVVMMIVVVMMLEVMMAVMVVCFFAVPKLS